MPLYDVNCHLLPGIDGGPASMDESVRMVAKSATAGVVGIAVTPDQRDVAERLGFDQLRRRMNSLRRQALENETSIGQHVRLHLGMENHVSPDLATLYGNGEAIALEETRFLLIRLPFNYLPDYTATVLDQLRVWRLQPIIAHPERNVVLQRDWRLLRDLVETFSFVQIAAGSILGRHGDAARNAAEQFIGRGISHVVASEMRRSDGDLSPSLEEARQAVLEFVGNRRTALLFETNPRRILAGVPPREVVARRRGVSGIGRVKRLFARR